MNLSISRRLLPAIVLALSLGGCGASSSPSSDSELLEDPTGTDTGADVGADTAAGGTDTGADTGSDTSGTDTGADTGSDTSGTDTGADTGSDTGGTDTGADTGSDTGSDTPSDANPDILVPSVEPGSDLERLLDDIHQQVSNTLLDLNQRLRSGTDLTEQQETCLGSYDPAVGEQLMAIDCGDRPLATGEVAIYVGEAAFHDTDTCHASLFDGNTSDCQLARASLTIRNDWTIPAGERRPVLSFAGTLIDYATRDTSLLHIDNDEEALAGFFSCTVDLLSGETSSIETGASCDSIIATTADRMGSLLD